MQKCVRKWLQDIFPEHQAELLLFAKVVTLRVYIGVVEMHWFSINTFSFFSAASHNTIILTHHEVQLK